MTSALLGLAVVGLGVAAGARSAAAQAPAQPFGRAPDPIVDARLLRVDDADRYQVEIDGRVEEVQVLGVRVVPFVDRSGVDPCGGPAALLAARDLLGSGLLRLEADSVAPDRGVDGALLRYVHGVIADRDLGATLLERGLATVERGIEFDRRDAYDRLEEDARRDREGLWPVCPSRLAGAGRPQVVQPFPSSPLADEPAPLRFGPPSAEPSRTCCRICRKGKACGNSCISRRYTCRKPPGCACDA